MGRLARAALLVLASVLTCQSFQFTARAGVRPVDSQPPVGSSCNDPLVPPEGSGCCMPDDIFCNQHPACQDAVCAHDSFCCCVAWDDICADLASTFRVCADCCTSGGPNGLPDPCYQRIEIWTALSASSVITPDLDGDGDADLVVLSNDDPNIAWFENLDGAGSLGPPRTVVEEVIGKKDLFAADLDSDGDLDLLVAGGDLISWFENVDGAGNFGSQVVIDILEGVQSVIAADLDGDGDLDIAYHADSPPWTPEVGWYWNMDGNGTFSVLPIEIATGGFGGPISFGDLDGDGDVDIVTAAIGSGLEWHENQFDAELWSSHFIYRSNVGAFVIDLDLDGDLDVLSGSTGGDTILWHENDGEGVFTTHIIAADSNQPLDVVAADVDGDGDPDVVSSSEYDHKVAWYRNVDGSAGVFAHTAVIDYDLERALTLFPANLDVDGDEDVLAIVRHGTNLHQIVSYEKCTDCNGNRLPDEEDLASGTSEDCNLNGSPDECDTGCSGVACDSDGDRCQDILDCLPADPTAWRRPGPSHGLLVGRSGAVAVLNWMPPEEPGGETVVYDVLRSTVPSDFFASGVCLETDDADTTAEDPEPPSAGTLFAYLIRVENGCRVVGAMGTTSAGVPRIGVSCP